MSNPYAPSSRGWSSSGRNDDDGWGPATSVRSGQDARATGRSEGSNSAWGPTTNGRSGSAVADPSRPRRADEDWSPAGPLPAREQRATRKADRKVDRQIEQMRRPRDLTAVDKPRERGLPWWAALLVLIVIAGIGGIIDTVGSIQIKGGFNIGIIVASIVAVLVVKRSHMFPVVIAPPIVYSIAAVFQLYIGSGGLSNKKVVFDAAANYLVYGFPAIAAATASVLIIAGIRLITRK